MKRLKLHGILNSAQTSIEIYIIDCKIRAKENLDKFQRAQRTILIVCNSRGENIQKKRW